jgi:predicted dehydrogenase
MALRVGIVGTGFGARVQVPGFRAAGYEITVICSAHLDRARTAAEQAGIPVALDSVGDLVGREDVDVVCVASPPALHREHTLAALAAGKHVICEKPMARDTAEAREMLAMAERAGVVHAIDHEFRYTPARSKVKELIEAHAIGEMRLALVMEMTGMLVDPARPRQEWWLRRDRAGGLLGAIGSHWIDSLIWWLGAVERVSSELGISTQARPTTEGGSTRVTADDTAQLLLRMSSGAIATIQLSSAVHHPSRRVILYGSDGTIVLGGDGRVLLARGSGALAEILPASTTDGAFPDFARRVREHIEAGPTGKADAPHPTFADGLRVQEVMDAAYRSAEVGGAVAIAN